MRGSGSCGDEGLLQEFQRREIQIKDLERGLIDFPALIGGKEVFLCWEQDEEDIEFWHELDAGYADGRLSRNMQLETTMNTDGHGFSGLAGAVATHLWLTDGARGVTGDWGFPALSIRVFVHPWLNEFAG